MEYLRDIEQQLRAIDEIADAIVALSFEDDSLKRMAMGRECITRNVVVIKRGEDDPST